MAAEPLKGWERAVVAAGLALAAVPFVRMANLVRNGTRTQYGDYWPMIAETFRGNGGLDLGGLFTLRNEHPVVVAKLLYWLNARILGGSNITLGWLVLLMAVAQLALLTSLLGSRPSIASRAAVVVAFSALLFAPQGSWSFMAAMSGTAWLSANLFALSAIWLRSRDHRLPAIALAGLASLSYATGLLAWPALLATGLARDRKPRQEWPVVAAAAVAGVWYLVQYNQHMGDVEPFATTTRPPLSNAGMLVGSILAPDEGNLTRNLGWLIMAVGIVLAGLALRSDARRSAPWTGLFIYSIGSVVLIALGRNNFLADFGSSRYISLPALVVASVLGLAVLVLRWTIVHVALCVLVAVSASASGRTVVDRLRDTEPKQQLLAVALRLDLAGGTTEWDPTAPFPRITPLLADVGHYPFDGRFSGDCGLLGTRLTEATSGPLAPQPLTGELGEVTSVRQVLVTGRIEFLGRLDVPVRCVVVADASRRVVGIGAIGYQRRFGSRPPPGVFTAIAPGDEVESTSLDEYEVYVVPRP